MTRDYYFRRSGKIVLKSTERIFVVGLFFCVKISWIIFGPRVDSRSMYLRVDSRST